MNEYRGWRIGTWESGRAELLATKEQKRERPNFICSFAGPLSNASNSRHLGNARFSPQIGHAIDMRNKRRILLATLMVAILGGMAWLLIAPSEPAYAGKPLSGWLTEYNHQNRNLPRSFDTPTDKAIQHMGTNAFPMIIHRLRYRDSALKLKIFQFLQTHLHLHFRFLIGKQSEYNAQGVAATEALGLEAKPLIPTLAEALDHMRIDNRAEAELWLQSLG